jgi:hypothetical protein
MKRRGLHAALTAVAIGLVLVAGVVAFNWGVVGDHAQAWWFQVTRKTAKVQPDSFLGDGSIHPANLWLLRQLASLSGHAVIYDPTSPWLHVTKRSLQAPGKTTVRTLREDGWRILEQYFPQRAYVVVMYPDVKVEVRTCLPGGGCYIPSPNRR